MRPHDTAPRGGSRGSGSFVNSHTCSDERGDNIVPFPTPSSQRLRRQSNTRHACVSCGYRTEHPPRCSQCEWHARLAAVLLSGAAP